MCRFVSLFIFIPHYPFVPHRFDSDVADNPAGAGTLDSYPWKMGADTGLIAADAMDSRAAAAVEYSRMDGDMLVQHRSAAFVHPSYTASCADHAFPPYPDSHSLSLRVFPSEACDAVPS